MKTAHVLGDDTGDVTSDYGDDGVPTGDEDRSAGADVDRWTVVLAHELRSPLGAVLMSLDELRPTCEAEPDARAALHAAERGSRQMARIIEDVLDLSRGRSDPTDGDRPTADLRAVVAGAVAAARPLLTARGHRLTVQLCPRLPTVAARASRVEQVLTNLLVNAAKFTDPGGHVRLTAEPAADGHAVAILVSDDGIGIGPDLLPALFDVGHRGPSSLQGPAPQGLGLGLALVRSLVELHGGTVTAHSDGPGRGSSFAVRLPACR